MKAASSEEHHQMHSYLLQVIKQNYCIKKAGHDVARQEGVAVLKELVYGQENRRTIGIPLCST